MSRFRFELATPEDDQQLRSVLSRTTMPGRFSLALQREPDFFRALAVEGPEIQVIACRDRLTNQIVGLGTRSIRERFVSGQVCRVGYLGSLRLLPEFRSATLVARGYQFFKELAQQDRVAWHFTSITDDNQAAVRLLTSASSGIADLSTRGHAANFSTNQEQFEATGCKAIERRAQLGGAKGHRGRFARPGRFTQP